MVGVLHLLRQPCEGGKMDIQCLHISKFGQSDNTPAMTLCTRLAIASFLGQTHDLGSVSQALRDFLRLPLEGVETQVQHGQQGWRISDATRHGNALLGHCYGLFSPACEAERTGQAGQYPGPQCTVCFWECMQRFLQEADRWLTRESWPPPRILEAKGSTSQRLGCPQCPGDGSTALECVTGLKEIAGFGLRLTQSEQQRTTLGIVHGFLAL